MARTPTGFEVYKSPEFKALCERFGIRWELPTKSITLTLTEFSFEVTQTYVGSDGEEVTIGKEGSKESLLIDTPLGRALRGGQECPP